MIDGNLIEYVVNEGMAAIDFCKDMNRTKRQRSKQKLLREINQIWDLQENNSLFSKSVICVADDVAKYCSSFQQIISYHSLEREYEWCNKEVARQLCNSKISRLKLLATICFIFLICFGNSAMKENDCSSELPIIW